jgi:DNA-directed RNA polymerase specialized sigma24 family protein
MALAVPLPADDGGGGLLEHYTDADLVELLAAEQFGGTAWRTVEAVLAAAAIPVLHDLLLGGAIVRKSFALDRPIRPTSEEIAVLRADPDERADLVHSAVVDGIRVFRKLTMEGRGWSPDRGASLLSYVINGCVMALANHFRRWRTRRSRMVPIAPLSDADRVDLASPAPDALALIQAEEDWQTLVGSMPQQLARAVELWRLTGEPWTRIAARLGISEKSLEGLLRRWRTSYRRNKEDWS